MNKLSLYSEKLIVARGECVKNASIGFIDLMIIFVFLSKNSGIVKVFLQFFKKLRNVVQIWYFIDSQ